MAISVAVGSSSSDVQLIGVPYFEGEGAAAGETQVDEAIRRRRGFEGKAGQVVSFDGADATQVALGLGKAADLTLDGVRRAAAAFVKAASGVEKAELQLAAVEVPGADHAATSQAVAEGIVLGSYKFLEFKTKADDRKLREVFLPDADSAAVERGRVIAEATNRARDWGNTPPVAMTPTRLADIALNIANENGLTVSVWDEDKIVAERLGGLQGVAAGSDQPPRLVEMVYDPADAVGTIALVGKGITFDSGGLSLKPPEGMIAMKTDMSGAANVIAVMSTLSKLAPKVKVIGLALMTENMPGPKATKPGDVLTARNGKTMEVLNTDAEGRLVLADGLSLAVEKQVDAIVDVATLTGGCVVALGQEYAGLMDNHEAFAKQMSDAADRTGELMWRLPLPSRYRKHIDSDVADIKNIGAPRGFGGTLTAGLFLKEFVGDIPWVHLDIAGPSRADSDDGYSTKGSTGYSVRTLIDLVENFTKP